LIAQITKEKAHVESAIFSLCHEHAVAFLGMLSNAGIPSSVLNGGADDETIYRKVLTVGNGAAATATMNGFTSGP
jgi:hypothetical protein